ncbi:hypothetical protein ABPG73_007756 [Tetrahymena malaccensis]
MKSFKISLEIRAFVAYSQKLEIKVEIIIYDYEFQNIDQVLKMLELVKNRKYIQQPIEIIKDNLMGMTLVVLELYDTGFLYNFFQNEVDSGQIRKIENLKYLSPKVCEQVRPYTFKVKYVFYVRYYKFYQRHLFKSVQIQTNGYFLNKNNYLT